MNTADPIVNITTFLSGGTLTFVDPPSTGNTVTYDYRYYRLVVAGSQSALVNMTLNGATFSLAGTTTIDTPIYSLTVNSGAGVVLFGYKSAQYIFGKYGSSSEGLGP